ncbi:hypothetical protein BDU57DRAFT_120119 [Ampelomyces quisqualis]|uniref:Uncharacterized protein n=1 Tax=Ampelomyces quisqualis TaxID=50730 RepID=A0A6A5QV61_AMPQU|nr:hypothetical protein BDU57DRAFT_120119 [Ampelomyces quisqualis]
MRAPMPRCLGCWRCTTRHASAGKCHRKSSSVVQRSEQLQHGGFAASSSSPSCSAVAGPASVMVMMAATRLAVVRQRRKMLPMAIDLRTLAPYRLWIRAAPRGDLVGCKCASVGTAKAPSATSEQVSADNKRAAGVGLVWAEQGGGTTVSDMDSREYKYQTPRVSLRLGVVSVQEPQPTWRRGQGALAVAFGAVGRQNFTAVKPPLPVAIHKTGPGRIAVFTYQRLGGLHVRKRTGDAWKPDNITLAEAQGFACQA